MSDSIIAALISALASISVAVISKTWTARRPTVRVSVFRSKGDRVGWYMTLPLLLLWLALSPAFIHHDLAGTNYFAIPIVTLILAAAAPIQPMLATSLILALYAANFIIGPLSNRLAGSRYDIEYGLEGLGLLLLLTFANAGVVAGICAWRRRGSGKTIVYASDDEPNSTVASSAATSLVDEMERLGELRASGMLSEEEFQLSKKRVLGIDTTVK